MQSILLIKEVMTMKKIILEVTGRIAYLGIGVASAILIMM
jgi:hypothetical protein